MKYFLLFLSIYIPTQCIVIDIKRYPLNRKWFSFIPFYRIVFMLHLYAHFNDVNVNNEMEITISFLIMMCYYYKSSYSYVVQYLKFQSFLWTFYLYFWITILGNTEWNLAFIKTEYKEVIHVIRHEIL